jgi:hypothetical protein
MTAKEELDELMKKGEATQQEAFDLFDSCDPIEPEALFGTWRGYELYAHHPMDGLLTAANWYGKIITDEENVSPLIFKKCTGNLFSANPGLLPLEQLEDIPRMLVKIVFPIITPFIWTRKPRARLRKFEYRGKLSAAMIYDQKPMFDMFRVVDENTVLGVTDVRWHHDLGCFFVLERI